MLYLNQVINSFIYYIFLYIIPTFTFSIHQQVLQEKLGVHCFLGLTATATLSTASDVARHLRITDFQKATVRGSPIPENLVLSVSMDANRDEVIAMIALGLLGKV